MLTCRFCTQNFPTVVAYFEHQKFHSSILDGAVCPCVPCQAVLKSYEGLKSHLSRHHRQRSDPSGEPSDQPSDVPSDVPSGAVFLCPVSSCGMSESNRSNFMSHIVAHFDSGTTSVTCPFTGCSSVLRTAGSLKTHVSRYHPTTACAAQDTAQHSQMSDISDPMEMEQEPGPSGVSHLSPSDGVADSHDSVPDSTRDANLFSDNFALFLLKLESEHHVPAATVQYIVKEMQNIHSLNTEMTLHTLAEAVPAETLAAVSSAFAEDAFSTASFLLSSSYRRHKYYKNSFCFVPPTEITLGINKQNIVSVYHYVPIEELMQFLAFCAPALSQTAQQNTLEDCYHDYVACESFKRQEQNVVRLILYLDEFEIANPLGSSRGNYKLLGVYMTLGNLPLHCRSLVQGMQLVMLCRQKDVKEFGLDKVLEPLTQDLVVLEKKGLMVNGINHHVRLDFITGDNLGSHTVGGFTQNFSTSTYFCRFCLLTRAEFHENPHVVGERRTPENYAHSCERLASCDSVQDDFGIVGNSPFHVLKHFHVCQPGLPPCIGHDVFEGVVQHDVPLYIKYFVTKKAWFSYEYLNNRISTMQYSAHDLCNKPAKVPSKGNKLGGHAMQNWTLLRLLPIYVGSKIVDHDDSTWQLLVKLMSIADLLMAPKITPAQVALLKVMIEDYVTTRCSLFPKDKLRPKHHYMLHYSELIQVFGPLCHVWTMRFEGKHQYFKQCIRSTKNFKNVTKTLSERHQLFQAFLAARGLFRNPVEFTDMGVTDQLRILSEAGHDAISKDSTLLKRATVDGVTYTVQDHVLVSAETRFDTTFGEIIAIVNTSCEDMSLLVNCVHATFAPAFCLYVLQNGVRETKLLHPSQLLDRTPYRPYTVSGASVVRLKSSFPEQL
uniref:Putative zxd family zinc finger c n=1 Tax=Rhipicephalus pulchellus TaxID=72859 RepID=L7LW54_RHIPC